MIYAYNFDLSFTQFIEKGEPIYDFFNNPNKFLTNKETEIISNYKKLKKEYEQLILYAPTYRNSKYGANEGEKIENLIEVILQVAKNNPKKYFLISLHPEEFKNKELEKKLSNLKNCKKLETNTEKVLHVVDSVIIDCSSIYYYSLYLNKNIICYFPDAKQYHKRRGLIFNKLEIIPQNIIANTSIEISHLLNNYSVEEEKAVSQIRRLFFPHELKNCSQKIFDEVLKRTQKSK